MSTLPKYPPAPSPIAEPSRLVSRPWLAFFQDLLNQAAAAGSVSGPTSSVNNEIVLFSGTSGAVIKAATGTGVVHATSGVYSVSDVTLAEIVAATAASRLLGRRSGSAGDWEEITLGAGLSMSAGGQLSATVASGAEVLPSVFLLMGA